MLREQVDQANVANQALSDDIRKLTVDWTKAREELQQRESEWRREEEVRAWRPGGTGEKWGLASREEESLQVEQPGQSLAKVGGVGQANIPESSLRGLEPEVPPLWPKAAVESHCGSQQELFSLLSPQSFNAYFSSEHSRLLTLWRQAVGLRRHFSETKTLTERLVLGLGYRMRVRVLN